MLPILVFDRQAIQPQLGYCFDHRWIDPGESLVTILWKFARANAIAGHTLAEKVSASDIDPYEGILPLREVVDWQWLHREHRIPRMVLRESLVGESRRHALHAELRYCRYCLNRGYLATIFMLAGVRRCPIHDETLAEACRFCGFRIPLRLNALLLDGPFVCPVCRGRLAGQIPTLSRHKPMAMAARIRITRRRVGLCLA
jgi:hypothetical protein